VTTTADTGVKAAVRVAFDAIVAAFPDRTISSYPDDQGGLWVEIADVPLGDNYVQASTFLVFLLPFTLPGADIYPTFVRPDLARLDGSGHGEGVGVTQLTWPAEGTPRAVMQLSRRTRRDAFVAQTAAQKIMKVIHWLVTK
jgi:hypothetical protein